MPESNNNNDNKRSFNFKNNNNRIVIFFLGVLVILFFFVFSLTRNSGNSEIPYSLFLQYLEKGLIYEVEILDEQEIHGKL